jgi:hypothetical protein
MTRLVGWAGALPCEVTMTTLSRREELAVSSAALSGAPWGAAVATGGVAAIADLGLHLITGSIGLSMLNGPFAFGAMVFFAVAAGGALLRSRPSRALQWARRNPWRFALAPALACAAVIMPMAMVIGGSGVAGALFSAFWHGLGVFAFTGVIGAARRRSGSPAAR